MPPADTVPALALLLLQVPPAIVVLKVVVLPGHRLSAPTIVSGAAVTATVKLHVAVPQVLVAVDVTVVTPTGNAVPDACE
jgi:hypothetical protein